eukprot:352763-Chlamydomonas_euryale.AAC.3
MQNLVRPKRRHAMLEPARTAPFPGGVEGARLHMPKCSPANVAAATGGPRACRLLTRCRPAAEGLPPRARLTHSPALHISRLRKLTGRPQASLVGLPAAWSVRLAWQLTRQPLCTASMRPFSALQPTVPPSCRCSSIWHSLTFGRYASAKWCPAYGEDQRV